MCVRTSRLVGLLERGRGRLRYMNGSKLTERCLHWPHSIELLSMPWGGSCDIM